MRFSIIVVCLNAGDDLAFTIDNILKQKYSDYEIVVKDGFSKDGSIDKISKDDKIKVYQKRDTGIYDAMNQGIEVCKGDYILFINAGDGLYSENVLHEIDGYILNNEASIFYGHNYNMKFKALDVVPHEISKHFCYRSMICHQATVYKSSLLKNRMYDTSFRVSADRERMLYAVLREQVICNYIPITISVFKSGGLSSSKDGRDELKKENYNLKRMYFSWKERVIYDLLILFTLPRLRKTIATNSILSKYYRNLVNVIYGYKK